VIKELVEAAPIIDAVWKLVDDYEVPVPSSAVASPNGKEGRFTFVDLASGKGYLSMFLSEMLPPEKVEGFVLVDKAWPMRNMDRKPHHISAQHIYGNRTDINTPKEPAATLTSTSTYYETWPIPMHTSKQDLKQKSDLRNMKKRLFDTATGPVVILAIHLCGTLALKAVDMFNNHDVKFLALKPCCLPGMVYANRGDVFRIGKHSFPASDVCSAGYFQKKRWVGPPRQHLEHKFNVWTDHLFQGIDVDGGGDDDGGDVDDDGTPVAGDAIAVESEFASDRTVETVGELGKKAKNHIVIQVDGGFQNKYLFAERSPLTQPFWERQRPGL